MVHHGKISKIKPQLGLRTSPEINKMKEVLKTKHCPSLKTLARKKDKCRQTDNLKEKAQVEVLRMLVQTSHMMNTPRPWRGTL